MTKLQNELKTKMEELIQSCKGVRWESAEGNITLSVDYKAIRAFMNISKDGEVLNYSVVDGGEEKELTSRQTVTFKKMVDRIEDLHKADENRKRIQEGIEQQRKERKVRIKERHNDPETVHDSYLDEYFKDLDQLKPYESYIYRNYEESRDNGYKILDLNDLPADTSKIEILVELLNKTKFSKIGVSHRSSGLQDSLFEFDRLGWKVNGMFHETKDNGWRDERKEVHGLVLERIL